MSVSIEPVTEINIQLSPAPENQEIRLTLSADIFQKAQANLYELAQQAGFKGTLNEFLDSLKVAGADGATFTPHIADGILSWTNDKGLANPESVHLSEDYSNLKHFYELAKMG